MRGKAFIAMFGWLVLFGCDDDNGSNNVSTIRAANGEMMEIDWSKGSGCDNKGGTVTTESGRKGKVTVDWSYTIPGVLMTLTVLTLVTAVARVRT